MRVILFVLNQNWEGFYSGISPDNFSYESGFSLGLFSHLQSLIVFRISSPCLSLNYNSIIMEYK